MNIKLSFLALSLTLAGCGGSEGTPPVSAPLHVAPPATEHLLTYGQSLSLGAEAVAAYPAHMNIPVADDENVGLMFAGGTKPDDLSEFVPFEESDTKKNIDVWGIVDSGETPLYGTLLTLKGTDSALHLGSASGRGGTGIAQLSKGASTVEIFYPVDEVEPSPYARLLAQVSAAKAISPGAYSVLGIIWMQGEADGTNSAYSQEFAQLVADLDSDIRAITGQGPIQWYVCTTAGQIIADQQRVVAANNPNVHIVCDDRDYPSSDGTHLTAEGSRAVGVAMGKAILANPL